MGTSPAKDILDSQETGLRDIRIPLAKACGGISDCACLGGHLQVFCSVGCRWSPRKPSPFAVPCSFFPLASKPLTSMTPAYPTHLPRCFPHEYASFPGL